MIMYWKAQQPFLKIQFCNREAVSSSYLLIVTKNLEFQKIYFGVNRDDLKAIANKRRLSLDLKLKETERAKEVERKADYSFIETKAPENSSLVNERKSLLQLQEAQIKRLDKVDKLISETEAPGSFLGMAPLSFYFD